MEKKYIQINGKLILIEKIDLINKIVYAILTNY